MKKYDQTRCCICGRFMSDDDVSLGWSRDLNEGGQEYAHYDCVIQEAKNAEDYRDYEISS